MKRRRKTHSTFYNSEAMKKRLHREKFYEYYAINISISILILAVFFYSALYSPGQEEHPIQCVHVEFAGTDCPTCGLSGGFSQMVRGNFSEARASNINTLPLFSFFVIQFLMRGFSTLTLYRKAMSKKVVVIIDASLSLLLFLICFRNLIQLFPPILSV